MIRRADGTSSFAEDLASLIDYWRSRGTSRTEIAEAMGQEFERLALDPKQPGKQNG